jgi:mRNA-degrading endonuclease YafQ of YafQ-DinJ toxin-antitoxin module
MQIIYSSKFTRQYKKLAPNIQALTEIKEEIFKNNPFDSRLKTHALSGSFEGLHGFSITYSVRIIFRRHGDTIIFLQIGYHDIYD